jgi:hypothetical protein
MILLDDEHITRGLAEKLFGAAAEEEVLHCSHRAHACPKEVADDCLLTL